ncbi:MAG: alpha/beta hydrolase [Cellvibrio sp.]|uniref:alpha/beta fold hydrolase n=1 Tax=Cellvibrio sp. TaxID=1965322 RepID=UPI00271FA0CD|nr:alpha/beta hydrolase [Cellvibrio sp.]
MIPIDNEKITIVLLPGLNGTAGLFDPLLVVATNEYELKIISYRTHQVKSYEELAGHVLEEIGSIKGRFVVVGESFSGPIAILLSAKNIDGLIGIILVATFASAPYFTFVKYLPWSLIFKLAKFVYWVRIKFSDTKNWSILKAASIELQKVSPMVLAARTRAALTVDVSRELQKSRVPVVYFSAKYDVVVPKWNLKKIIEIKPDIKVETFNTNHFLLQSVPQQAWEEIDKL